MSVDIANALPRTHLSIHRFARLLGINPVHFCGAVGSSIWPANGACKDIWPQYSWQTSAELVGRVDIANEIAVAEQDIANVIGCSVATQWEVAEMHSWDSKCLPNRNIRIKTEKGMLVAPGRRAVAEIETDAVVTYSDPDGDSWNERATITVATDITDKREIKVYHAGFGGDSQWEIRPLRAIVIAGGIATITLDAWLLIDPDLWESYPTSDAWQGIDVTDQDKFVDAVDVYREYNDTTAASVSFAVGGQSCCGGVGCDICNGSAFTGCFGIHDHRLGIINPIPAAYGDAGWSWYSPIPAEPIQSVGLYYFAGLQDQAYLAGNSLDPLSQYLAQAITWLAAARLPKSVCSCNNLRERLEELQVDVSRMRAGATNSPIFARFAHMDIFSNPFGMRMGEVKAWQHVVRLQGQIGGGLAL